MSKSIIPIGDRLLIRPKIETEKSHKGIVLPSIALNEIQSGEVLARGPSITSFNEGDQVLLKRGSGVIVELAGEKLKIVEESDVIAKFTD